MTEQEKEKEKEKVFSKMGAFCNTHERRKKKKTQQWTIHNTRMPPPQAVHFS